MGLADIPECTLEFWENRIRTDSIAAWINDWVIYDVLAETSIGSNKEEGLEGSLPQTLYGSYCLHCKQSGTQPKANKNFSPDLLELCRSVVGWETERKVTKTGKFIKGLRLRTDGDGNIPTHDYNLMQRVVTGGDGLGDGSGDGSELLLDKDFSKGDDSTLISNENYQPELLLQAEYNYDQEIDSDSSLTLNPCLKRLLTRHQNRHRTRHRDCTPTSPAIRTSTTTPTRQPQVFRVGDRATTQEQKGRWLLPVVVKS
jgi:putative DNA primase/helicase